MRRGEEALDAMALVIHLHYHVYRSGDSYGRKRTSPNSY